MTALSASGLKVTLGDRLVIGGLDIDFAPGESVALVGPNGAGKTTLLRALAGLLRPDGGTIRIGERPAETLDPNERARAVAYLPQGGTSHWPLTVSRLIELGRLPHRDAFAGLSPRDRAALARAVEATDIGALLERPFDQLSGGERARVLLARALAVEAGTLLADEPVAALDPSHQIHVMEILRERVLAGGTVVAVMHDLVLAARFSRRVILMDKGKVVASGSPASVLNRETLGAVYGVETIDVTMDGERYTVPWRRRDPPPQAPSPRFSESGGPDSRPR